MSNSKLIVGSTGGQINFSQVTSVDLPPANTIALFAQGGEIKFANSAGIINTVGVTGATGPAGSSGTSGISGTSGTSGVDGTSGVNGTSGTSGVTGASGTSGINGTSGTSGLSGELQVIGTNSLYTPSVGSDLSAASGLCNIAIGVNTCIVGTSNSYIAIGPEAKVCAGSDYGNGMAIGSGSIADRYNGIAVGILANAGQEGLAIGTQVTTGGYATPIAIGKSTCAMGPRGIAIGWCAISNNNGEHSGISIGIQTVTNSCCTIAIGNGTCASGAESIALGRVALSSGGQSVSIGKGSCSTGGSAIAIGNGARALGVYSTAVGYGSCVNGQWATALGNALAGTNAVALGKATANAGSSIAIGFFSSTTTATSSISIGCCTTVSGNNGVSIGAGAGSTLNGIAIGAGAQASATSLGLATAIGFGATASGVNSTVIGTSSLACHTGAIVFGPSITSERENTVHVNNLLALGQGVSKGHDIGATAGTVAIDWNNSNTQKVTMTGNITSLTLSNPIQGGVYSLIVEQGNASTNAITWPLGAIKWPGGTPPSLTTGATGNTDIVSLIYDPAGGTAYYGNSNANFS